MANAPTRSKKWKFFSIEEAAAILCALCMRACLGNGNQLTIERTQKQLIPDRDPSILSPARTR